MIPGLDGKKYRIPAKITTYLTSRNAVLNYNIQSAQVARLCAIITIKLK